MDRHIINAGEVGQNRETLWRRRSCPRPDLEAASSTDANRRRKVRPFRVALVDEDDHVYAAVSDVARGENWELDYYSDTRQALQGIPLKNPDVAVMDVIMRGLSGIDCAHKLKCRMPALPVVMLTASAAFKDIIFSIMAGVTGYLLKPVSSQQIRDAVSHAAAGRAVLCAEAQTAIVVCLRQAFVSASTTALSGRESQIVTCLIQGLSDKDISDRLGIAANTVHVHLVRLFRQFGVHSRDTAIQKFFELCIGTSCCHCRLPMSVNNYWQEGEH